MKAKRWLACVTGLLITVPAGGRLLADPGDGNDDKVDLSLAQIAALEAELGNGGAEDDAGTFHAGYDTKNGFHIRQTGSNGEDSFLIRFTGRLQGRYTYKGMSARGNQGGGRDSSTFELERARLGVRGHMVNPRLTYKIEYEAGTDSSDKGSMTDAFIYVKEVLGKGNKILNVGVGQFKPPFLRQERISSARLQFVDRSLTNEFFNIDRNVGLWADGSYGPLGWTAAVTNGFDSVNTRPRNIDQSPGLLARLEYNILRDGDKNMKFEESDFRHTSSPAWVIGAAFATDANNGTAARQRDPDGDPKFKVYTAEVDTVFKYMGLSLQAEYVARWLKYDPVQKPGFFLPGGGFDGGPVPLGETVFAHGFYAQGGFFLKPSRIEIGVRGSVIWDDAPGNGAAVEVGPVFNWFISRDHRVKFQMDVSYVDIPSNMTQPTEGLYKNDAFASSASGLSAGDQGIVTRAQVQFYW